MMQHLSDEDLLVEVYGEGTADERARVRGHLAECAECRALDEEIRTVLDAVDTTPTPEPPPWFERDVWRRLEPRLPLDRGPEMFRASRLPAPALAAGIVLLVSTAFMAGRLWERPALERVERAIASPAAMERLLRTEVEDHLDRSQRMLVELVNADLDGAGLRPGGRARAADLVAAGRLYRHSAEALGQAEVSALLDEIERVLVEVANGPVETGPRDLGSVRRRIADQDLLFRLRVVAAELHEREGPRLSAW